MSKKRFKFINKSHVCENNFFTPTLARHEYTRQSITSELVTCSVELAHVHVFKPEKYISRLQQPTYWLKKQTTARITKTSCVLKHSTIQFSKMFKSKNLCSSSAILNKRTLKNTRLVLRQHYTLASTTITNRFVTNHLVLKKNFLKKTKPCVTTNHQKLFQFTYLLKLFLTRKTLKQQLLNINIFWGDFTTWRSASKIPMVKPYGISKNVILTPARIKKFKLKLKYTNIGF